MATVMSKINSRGLLAPASVLGALPKAGLSSEPGVRKAAEFRYGVGVGGKRSLLPVRIDQWNAGNDVRTQTVGVGDRTGDAAGRQGAVALALGRGGVEVAGIAQADGVREPGLDGHDARRW